MLGPFYQVLGFWWRRRGVAPLVQEGSHDGFYERSLLKRFRESPLSTGKLLETAIPDKGLSPPPGQTARYLTFYDTKTGPVSTTRSGVRHAI